MHNGQVGGFDQFRKAADMMIPDALYADRKGATDSETLFLVACGMELADNAKVAMERAVAAFEAQSRSVGAPPHMRMAAALSDGNTLYAIRYASDALAPSLYYRWNAVAKGWCVASEPYETTGEDWIEVPKGSFCRFTPTTVEIEAFEPVVQGDVVYHPAFAT